MVGFPHSVENIIVTFYTFQAETALGVAGILQTAFEIIGRIRDARDRQKDLPEVLDGHNKELASMLDIVKLIQSENALQTAAIVVELHTIQKISKNIVNVLNTLAGNTGLPYQLFRGSKNQKKLDATMAELNSSKSSLQLKIQVACVGVQRTMEGAMIANARVIEQINDRLQRELGKGWELRMYGLIEGQPQDGACIHLACYMLSAESGRR
jgi:hypothetical protein